MGYGMEEEYNMALDGVQMGLILGHCRDFNSCLCHSCQHAGPAQAVM